MIKNDNKTLKTEVLEFKKPLFYLQEKTPVGWIYQLALEAGNWEFSSVPSHDGLFSLTHESGVSFLAELKDGKENENGTYTIKGSIENCTEMNPQRNNHINVNGVGNKGKKLRAAQLGAIYSLLAHWSLSSQVATIVLPTGTGKTETMLVAALVDRANKTLVIVPTVELKFQISDKFMSWGMLRELGVIPTDIPNPKVLVLDKLHDNEIEEAINSADVIISTAALLVGANTKNRDILKNSFTHVFFDEAHHVAAKGWNSLKELFNNAKIVQFTATPYRTDRKPIEGKIVYNYPLSHALEDGVFASISLVTVDERHPKRKDEAIARAAMDRLIEDRRNGFHRHKMMVRAETKDHADELFKNYTGWFPNERIVLIHNYTKGKKQIVNDIKNGKYSIIVCVDMLKEGFDYPDLKIAAVHSIHKSLAVLLQFIGRFTRKEQGLGDASFVVNYAEDKIPIELENLFLEEGSGWEHVIKEIADAKKKEAETLLSFLQGCQPYSGFDSPDLKLNPKLVYPALSCVCYQCAKVNWSNFQETFHLKKYALTQPFINSSENVFYFTTQKREKVKWARTKEMCDQKWDLIVMYHDNENNLLYVGFSEKRLDVDLLVEKLSGSKPIRYKGDCVFRSFDSIKRLSIVHAGIFKPANHLHRYSRLSGADVTTELTRWKTEGRCDKSDFVGVGYRDGYPVSIGASVKGKIWSPARVGNLKEWKTWCIDIGRMITDDKINSNQLLENSAKKINIVTYPDVIVLATDWAEDLYDRIDRITLELPYGKSFMLAEAFLRHVDFAGNKANFILNINDTTYPFSIVLGGEKGHCVQGLNECKIEVDGLKASKISIEQFFQENPPVMFLLNGCTISGCVHTDYGDCDILEIPDNRIEVLTWENVDYKIESYLKMGEIRYNSVQEYMMKRNVDFGAKVVFNDDNAGESADIVAIYLEEGLIKFELIHCKYSKDTSGARLSDLYEVCGQAIVSLRYKWKPEELIKHLERRNATGILKGRRFYHGSQDTLDEVKKALKYCDVQFEFAIAQPGVSASTLNEDMKRLLGSVYSTVTEMTETKLKCYFNR